MRVAVVRGVAVNIDDVRTKVADKMQCPACLSYTSDIFRAYYEDEPCPKCGLPASATTAVEVARSTVGDAKLKAQCEEALVRAGKAEVEITQLKAEVEKLRHRLVVIGKISDGADYWADAGRQWTQ